MALAMQARFAPLRERWRKRGYELDLGIGIAQGFATLGAFGFEGASTTRRSAASSISPRGCAARRRRTDPDRPPDARGARRRRRAWNRSAPLQLKGYAQPVPAFRLRA